MVDDPNRVPAAPAGESAAPGAHEDSGRKLKETIALFLPPPLRQAVEKGLLQTLMWLFFAVVVLPPLIALLAAFWLTQLGKFQSSTLQNLRHGYLSVIQEGFSMEEVAARSNVRLDYLQLFDYDLQSSGGSRRKSIGIDLADYQKASVDIKAVELVANEEGCSLPEEDVELVVISLGDEEIARLREETGVTKEIGRAFWARHLARSDNAGPTRELEFELTPEAKDVSCARVHISGGIRVFKDLVPRSPAVGSP